MITTRQEEIEKRVLQHPGLEWREDHGMLVEVWPEGKMTCIAFSYWPDGFGELDYSTVETPIVGRAIPSPGRCIVRLPATGVDWLASRLMHVLEAAQDADEERRALASG